MFLVPPLAALASFAVIAWLLQSGRANLALDQPNERSLHSRPVPRVGGLGIALGAVIALVAAGMTATALIGAVLAGVSFLDDRRGLPIGIRFAAHSAASAAFMAFHVPGIHAWLWLPLLPALVWMTNLYNFMDGSDGLAGGMAVFGFGAFAAAAALAGDASICLAALGIAAAALAFLAFNLPPARVFMGDAGSILLGFLAGALGLLGIARGLWPVWFPVLVFSPFIADASVTLIRRLFRGERIWEAHRSHYYQRLVQLGWGHRRTALVEYLLMAIVATLAVAGVGRSVAAQLAVVGVVVLLLTGSGIQVDRAWARHRIRTHAAD